MFNSHITGLVLGCATAQYGPGGQYGPNSGNGGSGNPYANGGNGGNGQGGFGGLSQYTTMVTAHAVLACLVFAFLFPIGGIIVRLANFKGLWWIHGLFQTFAYLLYIIAFGLGVHLATSAPASINFFSNSHPIIGIVVFVLLVFQPILGYLHHSMFKKHSRRVVWSYGHIWLGRFVITLGIINGGLGLQLARRSGIWAPSNGAIIAYGVIAGGMWLLYMAAAVYGEIKRNRADQNMGAYKATPPAYEEHKLDRMQYA
ncbi:hypothetical protein LTR86_007342 [Recurvomyces mirabilis]|nr:hypothetical protein LTR86_007342 [Recurvomyces mirabilis]